MKKSKSIIYYITIIILFVSIMPSLIFIINTLNDHTKTVELFENNLSQTVLSLSESAIKNEVSRIGSISSIIQNDSELINSIIYSNYSLSKLENYSLNTYSKLNIDFMQISDIDKKVIFRFHNTSSKGDFQHFLGLDNALQGETVLLANDEVFGWSVKSIVPISYEGEVIGTLTFGELIDDDFAINISSALGDNVDVMFSLPDSIVATSQYGEKNDLINYDFLEDSFIEKRTIKSVNNNGNTIFYCPFRIIDHTIGLVIIIDMSDSMAILKESLTNNIIYSAIIIFAAILIGIYLSLKIVNPLKKLTEKADRITEGITGKKIVSRTDNEITNLTSAFNLMNSELTQRNEVLSKNSEELTVMNEELTVLNEELTSSQNKLQKLNDNLSEIVSQRTKKINDLLKQKDEFIYQLGHDLKTPLSPILNLLPIVEEKTQDEEIKEIIKIIIKSSNRINTLVKKTLRLAKLNSTNFKLKFEDTKIIDQIDKSIERNNELLKNSNVIIKNKINDIFSIEVDKILIGELFDNILSNGIKYSPDGGTITIDASKSKNYITVSIKDEGIGLKSENIDNIFNEFYKVDDSRHDLESHGLGMSISKKIVEMHGGKIWVESPGVRKGCTFYIKLPKEHKDSNKNTLSTQKRITKIHKEIDNLLMK